MRTYAQLCQLLIKGLRSLQLCIPHILTLQKRIQWRTVAKSSSKNLSSVQSMRGNSNEQQKWQR